MKLRIENNSIRFRITAEELSDLNRFARVESATQIYSTDGKQVEGEFVYALQVDTEGGPARCRIEPSFIMLILDQAALDTLSTAGGDGFVYRRESTTTNGDVRRFIAYVEVDRKKKKRDRPEDWLEG